MNIVQKPVVNHDSGRFGYRPEAIVIHIAEGSLIGGYSWFNNPSAKVSAHYMIGKAGEVWQFVADTDTAWHAGVAMNPSWSLLKSGVNPNFYTIGIENEGFTGQPFTDAMYSSLAELIASLCQKFGIPLDRDHIIGHYQINSVNRSDCPGSGLDFSKLISLALNYYEDPNMIKELQQQVATLQSQLNNLTSQNQNLNAQVGSLKSQNQSLTDQVNSLLKANSDQTAQIQSLEGSGGDDVQVLRQRNAQLSQEVLRLQKSESDLTRQLNDLQNKNNTSTPGTSSGNVIDSIFNFFKGKNNG